MLGNRSRDSNLYAIHNSLCADEAFVKNIGDPNWQFYTLIEKGLSPELDGKVCNNYKIKLPAITIFFNHDVVGFNVTVQDLQKIEEITVAVKLHQIKKGRQTHRMFVKNGNSLKELTKIVDSI